MPSYNVSIEYSYSVYVTYDKVIDGAESVEEAISIAREDLVENEGKYSTYGDSDVWAEEATKVI